MDCKCYQYPHYDNCKFHSKKDECPLHTSEPKTLLDFLAPMMKSKESSQFINLLLVLLIKNLEESTQHPLKEQDHYHTMKRCNCEHDNENRRKHESQNSNKESFNESNYDTPSIRYRDHKRHSEEMLHHMDSTSSSSEHHEHTMKCHCNTGCKCQQFDDHDRDKKHTNFKDTFEEMFHDTKLTNSSSKHHNSKMKCHCNSTCQYCKSNQTSHVHQSDSFEWSKEHSTPSHCRCFENSHKDEGSHDSPVYDSSSHVHSRKRKTRYSKDVSIKLRKKTTTFKHSRKT